MNSLLSIIGVFVYCGVGAVVIRLADFDIRDPNERGVVNVVVTLVWPGVAIYKVLLHYLPYLTKKRFLGREERFLHNRIRVAERASVLLDLEERALRAEHVRAQLEEAVTDLNRKAVTRLTTNC